MNRIQELLDKKDYSKLKRLGMHFLYMDKGKHDSEGHISVSMGLCRNGGKEAQDLGERLFGWSEPIEKPRNGCIVVYKDPHDQPALFGVYKKGRVISKFGNGTQPVFSHTLDSMRRVFPKGYDLLMPVLNL